MVVKSVQKPIHSEFINEKYLKTYFISYPWGRKVWHLKQQSAVSQNFVLSLKDKVNFCFNPFKFNSSANKITWKLLKCLFMLNAVWICTWSIQMTNCRLISFYLVALTSIFEKNRYKLLRIIVSHNWPFDDVW